MKIGMISQWYEPESGAAAHPTAVAQALRRRGNQVRVLTSFPSYPLGRVHSGYRMGLRKREVMDGIELLRVPDLPSHDRSAVRRAGSLTSFAASASVNVGWLRDADACLVYLSPATVGVASLVLKYAFKVPFVLYVQDLWPESVTASGFIGRSQVSEAVEKGLNKYLARLYRGASGIAAISPGMSRVLEERGAHHTVVVPNWVDEQVFGPRPVSPASPELDPEVTWVMYAGGIGDVQGLEVAVEAFARARAARPGLGLAFVGEGVASERLERLARQLGVAREVRFLGARATRDMPAIMSQAAAQLISLRDLPLFAITIPSKVQACLAAGHLVVCAVGGDAAEVVKGAGGVVVTPEDIDALARAMVEVADMGVAERMRRRQAARRYYDAHLASRVGAARLHAMLETAALSRRPKELR